MLGNKVSCLGLLTHHEKLKAMWELEPLKDRKALMTFLGLAVYFSAYISYFSWMVTPLFKGLHQENEQFEWTTKHQKAFKLIKLALVLAPGRGHPEAGQTYQLYTDASDYAITGALQQIQHIAVKDLKGTRAYKRILKAYKRNNLIPGLTVRLSKEHDDRRPIPDWSMNWEETMIPVK
jgi:hypothetical protein